MNPKDLAKDWFDEWVETFERCSRLINAAQAQAHAAPLFTGEPVFPFLTGGSDG